MIRNPWKGIFRLAGDFGVWPSPATALPTGNFRPGEQRLARRSVQPCRMPASNASTAQDSTSNRSAQSYLSSLDPQGEQFKRDLEKAEAVAQSRRRTPSELHRYLASGGDSNVVSLEAKPLGTSLDCDLGRRRTPRFAGRRRICLVVPQPAFQGQAFRPSRYEAGAGRQPDATGSKTSPPNVAPHDGSPDQFLLANHLLKA